MSSRLQQGTAGLVLTLALSVASAARADDSVEDLARARFQAGAAALDANDLVTALRSFRAAYELAPCSEVLVTIAEVEERMGALPAAVASLQRYLDLAPEGSLAETARSRLEQLESSAFEAIGAASATPPAAASAELAASPDAEPSRASPSPQTRSTPVGVPTRPVPDAALVDAPLPQRRTPRIRLPAFIAFGVGGLGASGALATGLMAGGRYNDPTNCTNHCGDGHAVSSRALATTSAVLAGVAAAGIGAGIVLLLTTPARPEKNPLVPALRLKLTAEKAAAGAVWRF